MAVATEQHLEQQEHLVKVMLVVVVLEQVGVRKLEEVVAELVLLEGLLVALQEGTEVQVQVLQLVEHLLHTLVEEAVAEQVVEDLVDLESEVHLTVTLVVVVAETLQVLRTEVEVVQHTEETAVLV